ncbi:SGNH/GDSL hydrolase family protein [Microbacter margulisiae]|uniref:GDSL-like Lipase/Acylhydrolase family protein n=1 Tax=Microbacter margulisiae TaxID=1350067 RepID=A0A7W5DQ54_9PORP|nr:SGNH/GDSL hydrolase family protein [Microbacter margulisiae]MBB3186268.1 hypothetical protein [Microbacter margulisiae]
MTTKHSLILVLCLFFGLIQAQNKLVPYNNQHISYEGRILYQPNAAVLSWPGTSVSIRFKGTEISAIMQDQDTANYYNVIIDGKVAAKIHTDTIKHSYVLASGLKDGNHTVELFKRTEWDKGKTLFYGFKLAGKTKLLTLPAPEKRKIEFYGNSITCGYGDEDPHGHNSSLGCFENNYASYAAITARHFHAQYRCIAKSGIGIMVSWFPLIMPEMYNRLDPTNPASKWNFSKYTPDIVVINLFQNDSWIVNMPNNPQFKARFGTQKPDAAFIVKSYKDFVASIRKKYPHASIICTLGSMDATRAGSPWPEYVKQAVKELNDSKIYTHFFPYKNTDGHPSVAEQNEMATSLIQFINKQIQW